MGMIWDLAVPQGWSSRMAHMAALMTRSSWTSSPVEGSRVPSGTCHLTRRSGPGMISMRVDLHCSQNSCWSLSFFPLPGMFHVYSLYLPVSMMAMKSQPRSDLDLRVKMSGRPDRERLYPGSWISRRQLRWRRQRYGVAARFRHTL